MQIGKKYYGILMIRQSIDPQIFVLKPKYVISGILQEECGEMKLIDDMKGSYYLSDDTNTVLFEVETSVAFLVTEEQLKEKYPGCELAEAKSKYFEDTCKLVYFYNSDCVSEQHIDIISVDLDDLISRKQASLFPGVKDMGEREEKTSISNLLEHTNGDEIIAISTEELKKIIALGSYEEIRDRLQRVYNDTIEMNNHFLRQSESKKTTVDRSKRLSGENIVLLFTEVCDSVEGFNSIAELRKMFKSFEETLMNIMMILEKRGGPKADDCLAANDFICRLIDCFDDILKLRDLTIIKHEIKELKEKEMINIKQTAKIFDKYAKLFEEQNKKGTQPVKSEPTDEDKPIKVLKAREMKEFLDRKVVGQEEAKKDIISAIIMNSLSDDSIDRNACLLIGPTGSGKTLIISTIAQYLDKPVEIVDTMQLTVPGYVGANIEDYLSNLIDKAGGDVKRAEEGIISFDEIDKKGTEKNSDVSGRGVLNTLLSFIQGTTYQVKYNGKTVSFDTSRLTVFATGAFTDVVKELTGGNRSYRKKTIGFTTNPITESEEDVKYPNITIQDLAQYGHIPEELLGRISTITQLTGHTHASLREILISSESSPLLAEKRKLTKIGINLKWTEGYINAIIEQALKLQTGGRSLKSAVEKSIKEARWLALENLGEYTCIVLGSKTATDNLDCTLIDINGISHNLKSLVQKTDETQKTMQLSVQK